MLNRFLTDLSQIPQNFRSFIWRSLRYFDSRSHSCIGLHSSSSSHSRVFSVWAGENPSDNRTIVFISYQLPLTVMSITTQITKLRTKIFISKCSEIPFKLNFVWNRWYDRKRIEKTNVAKTFATTQPNLKNAENVMNELRVCLDLIKESCKKDERWESAEHFEQILATSLQNNE